MTIFKKNLTKFFLLNKLYKNLCVKFDAFSKQNSWFIFPPKEGAQKEKC